MKKLFFAGIIIWGCAAISLAQSGRRVKSAPAPPPAEVTSSADNSTDVVANSVGYSESAPNRARNISVKSRENERKSKKDSKTPPSTVAKTTAETATGDDEVVKVETNLVTIPVSVYDRNGIYIPNLQQKNFKIFEDGKEQEVAYFGKTDNPFTVVLLIDTSPSTEYKIEQIQDAANSFVEQLEPQDKVTVISFDSSVHTLIKEPTSDRNQIRQAINKTSFGSATALYDAVDTAIRKQLDRFEGRKAIVLFTDGVDTNSGSSYEKTVREAEESEAVIFPIYYNTYLQTMGIGGGTVMSTPPTLGLPTNSGTGAMVKEAYALGRAYLEDLAASTGGRVYRPESTPGGLNAAFEGIAEELRRQYSIGFYPQEESESGQRKQLRVRVDRPNLIIRSRDSYIVGEKSQSPTAK